MNHAAAPVLLLASASPRRRELLGQLGVPHRVQAADIDERRLPGERVADCVRRLAREKAARVFSCQPQVAALPVLAADTVVALEETLYGKPGDAAEAIAMLQALSGRQHRVLTAIALQTASGVLEAVSSSLVSFRTLSVAECQAYWQTGEPRDKAGGYAIQGLAAAFIDRLEGSYTGVMGLPLFETAQLLRAAGLPIWQREGA